MSSEYELLESYIFEIGKKMNRGDAREETYYSALEQLIANAADEQGHDNVEVTTLPKKTEAGNPDFRVWDGSHQIIGYLEAKKPDSNLHKIQESEQLKRYRNTFPNVILTDFFEFRLFKEGELVDKVNIGRPYVASKLGETPPLENSEEFREILSRFLSHSVPKTFRASSLARELAHRTRFMEHVIERELVEEENKSLEGFFDAFQQYLISGLSKEEFADLYAQTVTYGLFAARTRADGTFTRRNAANFIPSTIGILREVFQFISYGALPDQIRWIVDDIAEILNAADINKILKRYYDEGRGRDPVIHFYETFLSVYNPDLREQRGVYYTPEPVVNYIVNSVHQTLKKEFNKPLGLADSSVTVLDPAAGTLTFIAEAFKIAVNEYATTYGEGGVPELIREHLLEHFYAFELMMAPYAIGHLKMGFILNELGYQMSDDERFKLYLTNTLEMDELEQTELPGMASLSEESKAAGKIKKDEPVLVILGNPPYSGHSANNSPWIDDLLKEGYGHENGHKDDGYYRVDGEPLGERNPKWLQDDYVKFIRFAQWKIDQHGQGIVGFITNHSYLENPTFRGMRESLLKSFDEIRVLDLHGNYLKKETTPDGSKDDNVFDIRAGVAISLMSKGSNKKEVKRSDVFGLRKDKYEWISRSHIYNTDWKELKPESPFYFFKKQNYDLRKIYKSYISVKEMFSVQSAGIVTARDHFTIKWDKDEVWRTINRFKDLPEEEARTLFELGKDVRDWKVSLAQDDLKNSGPSKDRLVSILYRPFDKRYTYYTGVSRGFHCMPRQEVMKHMIAGENLGLCIGRQWGSVGSPIYDVAFVSESIIDFNLYRRGGELLFPLYTYTEKNEENDINNGGTMMMVFEEDVEYEERTPNLDKEFYNLLENVYGRRPTPEAILYYIYAVLYAPGYRQKYAEFLKSDFPRVPFTRNYELFAEIAEYGKELSDLHLMKSDKLDRPVTKVQGKGSAKIAKSKSVGRNYQPDEKRVYINKEGRYFEGITPEVWNYQIGGYQVMDKWLYDRREKELSNDEIQQYCRIATALHHTIKIQQQIDEIYPAVEEEVIIWGE